MAIKKTIEQIRHEFYNALHAVTNETELETVRIEYLGRNGKIQALMGELKTLSTEEKRELGPLLNTFKEDSQHALKDKQNEFIKAAQHVLLESQKDFDVTAYRHTNEGSLHPYTHIIEEIQQIFISMGFSIVDGPEVETPFYNFEALNIPEDHPAREMHDTFWLTLPGHLMRTHTSSVQIRSMMAQKPPLALCVPGRAYRHEATDATHDFVFTQLEGLVIDKNISIAHLLGTVKAFMQALFKNAALEIRVRPSYFPFVEPGLELDISCPFCTEGCSICKKRRWIELGGAGLVHPSVLKACGINPQQWSGFAWGMGIERFAMLKYGINDIRLFKTEKLDFLKQF